MGREVIVRSTHRGLRYVDGRLDVVLEPGRYRLPRRIPFRRRAFVEVVLAAVERVADYPDRLYSDVQLAARRSLASMTLEAILTNRNQLSEDILRDVEGIATGYGVAILRADVKDLAFPGNLQDVMNRVLTAQRLAEAHLVEARTAAERGALEASARAEATQRAAQADAEATRIRAEAEVDALNRLSQAASAYAEHPALLRLRELETMAGLSANPAARLYIGFDKHRDQLPHNDR